MSTIRGLCMDAVQAANSGHPGLPLAMAPAAYVLFTRVMRHDPRDPGWPDRDRFVLSAGHGSMLLYSLLHLSGYELALDELRRFRQWGSQTPGHPERGVAPGVETSTGPLGQGFANGVGMAIAERFLRERFGASVVDHRVFGICSDGDLMEGVSAEAASLAGHLGLGRLVYLYDDNRITIDGETALSFDSEDVTARFDAYGWQTLTVADANDLAALEGALDAAVAERERPSLVRVRSVIADPAPTKRGTAGAHGAPLGVEEVRATKLLMGLDPDRDFQVSEEVYAAFEAAGAQGTRASARWAARVADWRAAEPGLAGEWDDALAGHTRPGVAAALPVFDPAGEPALATRAAGGRTMAAFAAYVPTMVGGSADLAGSTSTAFPEERSFTRAHAGRNVHWGVREHAMAAAVNGLALHGQIVKPYGSTFLVFADYMRPAIRLSALMGLPVVWVFSHDSLAVGQDGPTHQPVEQLAALRAIPGLTVIRPADAAETAQAWRVILELLDGPACLILTRQAVPVLDRARLAGADGLQRGAYVLAETDGDPHVTLVGTGSEVAVALDARALLAADAINARVVSMPSWELFERQPRDYHQRVLPTNLPSIAIEAGVNQGWHRWVDATVTLDRYGASAPGPEVMQHLGITPQALAAAARAEIDQPSARRLAGASA